MLVGKEVIASILRHTCFGDGAKWSRQGHASPTPSDPVLPEVRAYSDLLYP